jgi:hypothetical protein
VYEVFVNFTCFVQHNPDYDPNAPPEPEAGIQLSTFTPKQQPRQAQRKTPAAALEIEPKVNAGQSSMSAAKV